jgi:hypothetical protein
MTLPITPAPAHALLLRSVAAEIAAQPWGVYEWADVLAAADQLLEVLAARTDAGHAIVGDTGPAPGNPLYPAMMQARRIAGRLEPGEPVYVSLNELVEHGRLPSRFIPPDPIPGWAIGAGARPITEDTGGIITTTGWELEPDGISWPEFEQCARHAVAALERTTRVLDGLALGVVIYGGDLTREIACADCAGEAGERLTARLQADVDEDPTGVPTTVYGITTSWPLEAGYEAPA